LSKRNITKRNLWCKEYSKFSQSDWKEIIFLDEVKIEMHSTHRRNVRRRYGDSLKFRYVLKTIKYGGFIILLWGAIKGDGSRILVRCPNRLNSEEYQRVLSKELFEVYEASNIFMQDGAICHKSQSTIEFLDQKNVTST